MCRHEINPMACSKVNTNSATDSPAARYNKRVRIGRKTRDTREVGCGEIRGALSDEELFLISTPHRLKITAVTMRSGRSGGRGGERDIYTVQRARKIAQISNKECSKLICIPLPSLANCTGWRTHAHLTAGLMFLVRLRAISNYPHTQAPPTEP